MRAFHVLVDLVPSSKVAANTEANATGLCNELEHAKACMSELDFVATMIVPWQKKLKDEDKEFYAEEVTVLIETSRENMDSLIDDAKFGITSSVKMPVGRSSVLAHFKQHVLVLLTMVNTNLYGK